MHGAGGAGAAVRERRGGWGLPQATHSSVVGIRDPPDVLPLVPSPHGPFARCPARSPGPQPAPGKPSRAGRCSGGRSPAHEKPAWSAGREPLRPSGKRWSGWGRFLCRSPGHGLSAPAGWPCPHHVPEAPATCGIAPPAGGALPRRATSGQDSLAVRFLGWRLFSL